MLSTGAKPTNDGVGKGFPTVPLMTAGGMGSHGQCSVEQEYALGSPAAQTAALRNGMADVGLYFLKDITQGRGKGDAIAHAKTKAFSLAGLVVGILTQKYDANAFKRA